MQNSHNLCPKDEIQVNESEYVVSDSSVHSRYRIPIHYIKSQTSIGLPQ